jgi:hypothetical protein
MYELEPNGHGHGHIPGIVHGNVTMHIWHRVSSLHENSSVKIIFQLLFIIFKNIFYA